MWTHFEMTNLSLFRSLLTVFLAIRILNQNKETFWKINTFHFQCFEAGSCRYGTEPSKRTYHTKELWKITQFYFYQDEHSNTFLRDHLTLFYIIYLQLWFSKLHDVKNIDNSFILIFYWRATVKRKIVGIQKLEIIW